MEKKINMNDLRSDRGGDPDIYRRALSSSSSSSSCMIDEALSLDARRRSALADIESLRSKVSSMQKDVIAPRMKAKEDVSAEVTQLKGWKMEIARLSTAANDAERGRDEILDGINAALANIELDDGGTNPTPLDGVVHSIEKNLTDDDATTTGEGAGAGAGADGGNDVLGVGRNGKGTRKTLSISAPVFSPKAFTAKSKSGSNDPGPSASTAAPAGAAPAGALPLLLPEEIKSIPPREDTQHQRRRARTRRYRQDVAGEDSKFRPFHGSVGQIEAIEGEGHNVGLGFLRVSFAVAGTSEGGIGSGR